MITENTIKILFEATGIEQLKQSIDDLNNNIKKLGNKETNNDGIQKLSDKIKEMIFNFLKLEKISKKTSKSVSNNMKNSADNAKKFNDSLKSVNTKFKDFISNSIIEYGKTQTAFGEMKSLGIENLENIRQVAIDFSNTWSGTTRENFITASYDIKSGISSLTDESIAQFTKMAALTGKATKSTLKEMTALFAQGYNIYRNQFASDTDFSEKFSAGISKSVEKFRTTGNETASFLSSLGTAAEKTGVSLAEVLAVGGELQATMTGSEAATKFQAFISSVASAGKDLGLSFLDANNRLKSIPEIIDTIKQKYGNTIDALESQELAEAFGTDEAVDMIDLLYDKTQNVVKSTKELSQAMNEGSAATEKMASAMNEGMVEKFEVLKQRMANIFEGIGRQIEPYVSESFDALFDTLDQISSNGSLDSITQGIGQTVGNILQIFNNILSYTPNIINAVSNAILWLAQNFEFLLNVVGIGISIWLAYKTTMLALTIATNPLIAVIGLVIFVVVKLYTECDSFRKIVQIGFEIIKLAVLGLARLWLTCFNNMVQAIKFLTSWIPGIGDAVTDVANVVESMLGSVDQSISNTANNLANLMSSLGQAQQAQQTINSNDNQEKSSNEPKNDSIEIPKEPFQTSKIFTPEKSAATSKVSTPRAWIPKVSTPRVSESKTPKDDKTIFEKEMDKVDNSYKTKLDLIESQIELAEAQDDKASKKSYQQSLITALNEKLKSYETLAYLTTDKKDDDEEERNILETTKNKLLSQIARAVNDIKDKSNELIGEFNTPSELTTLTQYMYTISNENASTLTRIAESPIYNNTYKLYLTVKDLGKESATSLRDKLNNFANILMSKNDIVYKGTKDVMRN